MLLLPRGDSWVGLRPGRWGVADTPGTEWAPGALLLPVPLSPELRALDEGRAGGCGRVGREASSGCACVAT